MTVLYLFDDKGYLYGLHQGNSVIENSTTKAPIYTEGYTPQYQDGAWIDQSVPTIVTRVTRLEFKELFTSAERVAIKKARASDDLVEDFFSIAEDPDSTGVDLALPSTENVLFHLEGLGILTEERHQQILAGVPQ